MARVLVGVPTKDRARLLAETIGSVRAQTLTDLAVVVSDDASAPDQAREVAEHLAALGDERITLHAHDRPQGEYGQGRFLFSRRAGEEYFVILHDDDLIDPRYLETAVDRLDREPGLVAFVSNCRVIDLEGAEDAGRTDRYLAEHGRHERSPGPIDLLEPMLRWGFVPISGTVFRTSALEASGFVDEDATGNYPFELDLILGLAARGGRAWFCAEPLIAFRYHRRTLRVGLWYDPRIVDDVVRLLGRHRFEGSCERLRRRLLGNKRRRQALLRLAAGDRAGARAAARAALGANALSVRSWLMALGAHLAPGPVARWCRARVEASRGLATFS